VFFDVTPRARDEVWLLVLFLDEQLIAQVGKLIGEERQ
jgi:hypothetical protein